MSEQENLQVVQQLYSAFQRGDLAAFQTLLADDVKWLVPGPKTILPWAGPRQGREQTTQFFTEYTETAETEQFEPQEFFAHGQKVVVLGHRRDRIKATGRLFESDWVHVYTLRAGQVVNFQGYYDTAAMVAAFGSE